MRKQISYVLCISLLIASTTYNTTTNAHTIEGYLALQNYIQNTISQHFYPNHGLPEVKRFMQSLTDRIHNQESGWFALWADYDQGKVYQISIGETIEFIAQQARRYGSRQTSELIKEEVTRKIMNIRELPPGILSEYIGNSLRRKVSHIESAAKPPVETHQNLYPSEECCICYSAFDGSVEQIFLVPCGHDLCKDCCKSHFFKFNNRTCPQCRTTVNKEQLQNAIYGKVKTHNYRSVWD